MNKVIPIPQHRRLLARMQLQVWRMKRIHAYAQRTGQTPEQVLNQFRQRCGNLPLPEALDMLANEIDTVVEARYHSSNEPVIH